MAERLPPDGRDAMSDITRVERIIRDVLAPDVPTWDVCSVQGVGFDEFCYCDAFGTMCLWTQSIEVNTRLALEAVASDDVGSVDHVAELRERLGDKWALKPIDARSRRPRKVWFPPGGNLAQVVSKDRVQQAFDTDRSWHLKPHPITTDEDVRAMILMYGASRVLAPDLSGYEILLHAETVGYTTTSEMGLIAMMFGKDVLNFSLHAAEHRGRLYSLYRAIRESPLSPPASLNRLLRCRWSGLIPLYLSDTEVAHRVREFRRRAIHIREHYRPLVPRSTY